VNITGHDVHPGHAKNVMINAVRAAAAAVEALPVDLLPETTDGRQPYLHPYSMSGEVSSAQATVSRLINQFGFDVVDAGPLKEGWRIQRDTPGYGPRRTAEEIRRDLAAARRYVDQ
jgi:predicted dinucleotide-binding enzyme